MELREIKETVDDLNRDWIEFKAENDKGRRADREKLDRINSGLDDLCKQQDRLETALNRSGVGGDDNRQVSEAKAAFDAYLRKGKDNLSPDEIKVLTVGDSTQAGYLAPDEYVREIIKGVVEFSPIRSIARIRRTSSPSIKIPRRTGQFAAVWVAEQAARNETTGLKYGLEEIPTNETTATVDVSMSMLEDSAFDLDEELQTEFSEQFGVTEGTAFVGGTAVGQPEGFMTNGDILSDNSGDANEIIDGNGQANGLITLQHNLKEAYALNATWVLRRKTIGAVRKMKDGNNNYIWQPGSALGDERTILGDPYVEATDMPDEGTDTFPIAYGDFRRAYSIVDRVVMSVLQDPYTQATSGNVRFIARRRVGGQVVLAEAIRKLKCAV